ncbi:adenylate/guanylate cyclase domain-containing protein [Reichenbachiella versicolor]|uniref:adenylate/guanylate cyclase domain-containing protein n=1 Tax=Reichenbachiella versicolor TaxID=1821036 RepID=UPI000D6E7024|nr:adenylate/guanylate cyclase domain-containing protein [Reichenbachiella versicolor]
MFKTFRLRLLFWFLVFISSSFFVVLLSLGYIQKREKIFDKSERIDRAYLDLLKSVKSQQNFFSYETKNPEYFLTSKSKFLSEYQLWMDSTSSVLENTKFEEADIQNYMNTQRLLIHRVDSVFTILRQKIKERGFKDYSLEGEMRTEAHWLENTVEIPRADLLTLRRHEKDYIIRNEPQYVQKFSIVKKKIESNISQNKRLNQSRRATLLNHLDKYENTFIRLVELDQEIGIKDNTGLRKDLDIEIASMETEFGQLVERTKLWAKEEFDMLTFYFAVTVVILVLISIVISAIIAHKITQPLTRLTAHITQFVDSNFTLESDHPISTSKDEIGSLTQNFSILKNEVISQMKFFKQRVEERTIELANANKKLIKVSEANDRFVPTEFVNILNKKGIEEVELGDQKECEMTIVFTDIREFTHISESLTPQENFDFLNHYLGGIVPIIKKHGGFIDKFIGDSVMALFPGKADDAILAAMEFNDFVTEFNLWLEGNKKIEPIKIGTGIHTGNMILGTVGHDDRMETTVISDAVNTAARVERLTKHYGVQIMATAATLDRLEDPELFNIRFLDKVKVKGKKESLSVMEIMFEHEIAKIDYNDRYHEGIFLLEQKKLKETAELFKELLEINPNDKALKRFLKKYKNFQDDSTHQWKDVTEMQTK